MADCPATREAVVALGALGAVVCGLCGRGPAAHRTESALYDGIVHGDWQDEPGMEHLRDDAPYRICSGCGRKTWAGEDGECLMPQPDRTVCAGTFGELIRPAVTEVRQIDDVDERTRLVRELDVAHGEAVKALRAQGVKGQYLLFVPEADEDGNPGVRMMAGGNTGDPAEVEVMLAGTYRCVIDLINSMNLDHLL